MAQDWLPYELVAEGLTIRGAELKAEGVGPASGWTVIMSHGFGSKFEHNLPFARGLARGGARVFAYDFPGSGSGSSTGRDSWDMSVLTEADDLELVFDDVRARPGVDPARVALAGASQGGFVSALVAARRPAQVARLVMLYPALCIPDDARAGSSLGAKYDPADPPERFPCLGFVTLGRRYVLDAQTLDPWEQICSYEGPVLVVHGTADAVVDVEYAREAARRYPQAELVEIAHAQHGFPTPLSQRRAISETLGFLSD